MKYTKKVSRQCRPTIINYYSIKNTVDRLVERHRVSGSVTDRSRSGRPHVSLLAAIWSTIVTELCWTANDHSPKVKDII